MEMSQKIAWNYLAGLVSIAAEAGAAILDIYDTTFGVSYKDDLSPLTVADQRSHSTIVARLKDLYPELPVLSEEGKAAPYEERKEWERFWLVDPLDGTKEFVKKNGEFTVNIALISGDKPVIGLVYVPVKGAYYFAAEKLGAYKLVDSVVPSRGDLSPDLLLQKAQRLPLDSGDRDGGRRDKSLVVIASRSHISPEVEGFIKAMKKRYASVESLSAGSSLKFCLVAEGTADAYPRFGPTMEWDTAAGQCIVEESGGSVFDLSGNRLRYNKQSLLNGDFIAARSSELTARIMEDK